MSNPNGSFYCFCDKFMNKMLEWFVANECVGKVSAHHHKLTFHTSKGLLVFDSQHFSQWGFRCAPDRLDEVGVYRAWRPSLHYAVVCGIFLDKFSEMILAAWDQRDQLQDSLTMLLHPHGRAGQSVVQNLYKNSGVSHNAIKKEAATPKRLRRRKSARF